MPIVGPASYVPVTEEFLEHWLQADTELGVGNEILLPGPVLRAALQALKDALVAKRAEVQGVLNDQEIARGDLELKKGLLLLRLNQFNDKLRAFFPGSKWLSALPKVPSVSEGPGNILDPLDDVATLWLKVNADPGTVTPVTLLGAYTQAMFATELAALKTAYGTLNAAGVQLKLTRYERNAIQEEIHPILKSFRLALPTYFAKTHPLVVGLPEITPAPGSTPAGVTLNAVWDVPSLQAKLTWAASPEANVEQYEIRFCPGPNYSTDDESVIGSVPAGPGPFEFLTDVGLSLAGNLASFKVYVVTTTGHEKGSNAATVTRP